MRLELKLAIFAGNNAVEMQTTATFDQSKDEFVITTPTTLAQVTTGTAH